MKNRTMFPLAAAGAIFMTCAMPIISNAQTNLDKASNHRNKTKNDWRNIGIGSAALGVLGLATHNKTLLIGGAAGAAYSASRYEHDRRSQSKIDRARANLYGKSSIMHNGHRYVRHTHYKGGQKYYSFERG